MQAVIALNEHDYIYFMRAKQLKPSECRRIFNERGLRGWKAEALYFTDGSRQRHDYSELRYMAEAIGHACVDSGT